jgi:ubiquinone/menaquinone biosynthesis C-methylase UbiE
MKFGAFQNLAKNYNKYRPGYNLKLVNRIFSKFKKDLVVMDIGCGTGIFTKILAKQKKIKVLYAIDPSSNMLAYAKKNLKKFYKLRFKKTKAEQIKFKNKFDIITSASSFHWYTKKAYKNLSSSLKKNGLLILLWNPRITEMSKDEHNIQKILDEKYLIKKRYSSGRNFNEKKIRDIFKNNLFKLISSHETTEKKIIKKKKYLGAWMSVNDIRVQLGDKFNEFIFDITKILKKKKIVNVYYQTKIFILKKIS